MRITILLFNWGIRVLIYKFYFTSAKLKALLSLEFLVDSKIVTGLFDLITLISRIPIPIAANLIRANAGSMYSAPHSQNSHSTLLTKIFLVC